MEMGLCGRGFINDNNYLLEIRKNRCIAMKSNDDDDFNYEQMKPKILPLANGLYYLIKDMKPRIVENLQNFKGDPLSTTVGIALCRCGHIIISHFVMVMVSIGRYNSMTTCLKTDIDKSF